MFLLLALFAPELLFADSLPIMTKPALNLGVGCEHTYSFSTCI